MTDNQNVTEEQQSELNECAYNFSSAKSTSSKLMKFYELSQSTKSTMDSKIYAATGIKYNQKKLIISFIITLVRDFALAYTVRGSLKLIPKFLKMLQSLK